LAKTLSIIGLEGFPMVKTGDNTAELIVVVARKEKVAIDDLDKTINLFMGRIREWYGLHFPELDRLVEKHETYARLVANLGRRDSLIAESLEKEGLPRTRSEQIAEVAQKSMGADLEDNDLAQIQTMCKEYSLMMIALGGFLQKF